MTVVLQVYAPLELGPGEAETVQAELDTARWQPASQKQAFPFLGAAW